MAENSNISWLDGGHTASPWHGCSHATYTDSEGVEQMCEGCRFCYAEAMSHRNPGTLGVWGPEGKRVRSASFAKNCLRWNREAERDGVIRSVFPSICDIFEDWRGPILDASGRQLFNQGNAGGEYYCGFDQPLSAHDARRLDGLQTTMDNLRRDLFATIDSCPHLRFLLLTKRPQNIRRMWESPRRDYGHNCQECGCSMTNHLVSCKSKGLYRRNVCLIASVSDQPTADALIPPLLGCADLCPILGISAEPLLGPIDLENVQFNRHTVLNVLEGCGISTRSPCQTIPNATCNKLGWVIAGGESGSHRRPCEIEWFESLREQCRAAGVAFWMKQDSALKPGQQGRVPLELWNVKENPCLDR
jgi:protein gp37